MKPVESSKIRDKLTESGLSETGRKLGEQNLDFPDSAKRYKPGEQNLDFPNLVLDYQFIIINHQRGRARSAQKKYEKGREAPEKSDFKG